MLKSLKKVIATISTLLIVFSSPIALFANEYIDDSSEVVVSIDGEEFVI